MKKKLNDVTIIAILMVAVIIMGCMMFSSPKNNEIKRIALTATTTSITTTSTTTMTSTATTTTTTDNNTTTSRTTATSISTTTLADITTVTTTTSPVESTTDTYKATVIYKEEQPELMELFDQELYYEPIEMIIEETTIEDKDIYYFYEESMRVHTPSCIYADPSCMEVIEDGYIDCARRCTECNPDIEIGTIYEEDDDTYYEESDSLTRNWTVDEMTYYSGPYGCYGAAGRTLIHNYSVACNSIPLGTIVYIQSSDGSVDGYYRVDDTGGMGDNVIDIFYSDYSYTPYSFRQAGRVSCTVWIVE